MQDPPVLFLKVAEIIKKKYGKQAIFRIWEKDR